MVTTNNYIEHIEKFPLRAEYKFAASKEALEEFGFNDRISQAIEKEGIDNTYNLKLKYKP